MWNVLKNKQTKILHRHGYSQPLPRHLKLSSGASFLHGSSVHVCIRSCIWRCMSEHELSHEVQGLICRPPREDRVKAQIWRKVQIYSCVVGTFSPREHSGPQELFLELAAKPVWVIMGKRASVSEVIKNWWSLSLSFSIAFWREESLPEGQSFLLHSTDRACMVRHKPLLSKDTWQPAWSMLKGT